MGMKTIITEDLFGGKHEAKVADLHLSVHVYGMAIENGKALVVPQKGGYDWPGGTMELGETLAETLKRECREETGLELEPVKLVGAYTSFFHHVYKHVDTQGILMFYLAKVVGGEISSANFSDYERDYAMEAQWIPLEELKKLHHVCSVDVADELFKVIEEECRES